MPVTIGSITVSPPAGTSVVVNITFAGHAAVLYTAANGSSTATNPATISTATTYYADVPGTYVVSCKVDGIEIAGTNGDVVSVAIDQGTQFTLAPTIEKGEIASLSGTASTQSFSTVSVGDGTASAPSVAFTSDADGSGTGLFRAAANQIGIAINGTQRFQFAGGAGDQNFYVDSVRGYSATGVAFPDGILVGAGTVSVPAIAFSADADGTGTGIYRAVADTLSISVNGVQQFNFQTDGSHTTANLTFSDSNNVVFGTTTGTQLGTASTQKLGVFAVLKSVAA